MQLLYNCTLFEVYFVLKACLQKNTTQPIKKRSLKKKGQPSLTYSLDADQSYTYQVLRTIRMKLILLCVWAEPAVLGSAKTALKFIYKI